MQQSHGAVFLAYFVAQWSRAGRIGALPAAATPPLPPLVAEVSGEAGTAGKAGKGRQAGLRRTGQGTPVAVAPAGEGPQLAIRLGVKT